MIFGVSHICFGTTDLGRFIQFYEKVFLGEVIHTFLNPAGVQYGAFIKIGGNTFVEVFMDATLGEPRPPAPSNYRHFCIRIADLKAFQEHLSRLGQPMDVSRSKSDKTLQAWITDPDGNKVEIHFYDPESSLFKHVS